MMFGWILSAKLEALEKRTQAFCIILVAIMRFRWITNFIKIVTKKHPTATKIGAAGAQGPFVYDSVLFLDAPKFLCLLDWPSRPNVNRNEQKITTMGPGTPMGGSGFQLGPQTEVVINI